MSLLFTAACSAVAAVLSVALAGTVVRLFAKPDTGVYELAIHGMYLFATGFLFMGLNIFASGLLPPCPTAGYPLSSLFCGPLCLLWRRF